MSSATVSSDVYRRYSCTICNMTFKRKEHLSRHELRHTTDRPHICPLCRYSFSRRDALMRHVNSHARNSDSRDPEDDQEREAKGELKGDAAEAAPRTVAACDTCALLKIRCDDNTPCRSCLQADVACSFTRRQRRSGRVRQIGAGTLSNGVNSPRVEPSRPPHAEWGRRGCHPF